MHAFLAMGVILTLATIAIADIHQHADCSGNVSWHLTEHDFGSITDAYDLRPASGERRDTLQLDAISSIEDLSRAEMRISDITNPSPHDPTRHVADLIVPDLSRHSLIETVRSNRNLSRMNLRGTFLIDEHLTGPISGGMMISGGKRTRANLPITFLAAMILAGAAGAGAIRSGLDMCNADLTGADLRFEDLSELNLSGAILFEADLTGANLSEANLTGANLNRAILIGADLSGGILSGATLLEADLRGADLRRADLRDTDIEFAASLEGAMYDEVKLFPTGFDPQAYNMIHLGEYTAIESSFSCNQEGRFTAEWLPT